MQKVYSQLGFLISLIMHSAVFASILAVVKAPLSTSNVEQVDSISIEMFMASVSQPEVAVMTETAQEAIKETLPKPVPSVFQSDPLPVIKPVVKKIPSEKPKVKPEKTKVEKIETVQKKEQPKQKQAVRSVKALEKGNESKQGIVAKAMPNSSLNRHTQLGVVSHQTSNMGVGNNGTAKTSSSSEINAYKAQLQRNLQQRANNIYPQREKLMRKTGTVTISFTVSASGQLTQANVVQSSGNSNLDNAALKAAQSTKMDSPPPVGFPKNLIVPIRFSIS